MDGQRVNSRLVTTVALAVVFVLLVVAGCADDPLLSPEGIEDTDTGGSYGKLEYPSETGWETSRPRDSTHSQSSSPTNPEQF